MPAVEAGNHAGASSASTAGAGATAPHAAGVGMNEMIESINATIEIAVRQGATQARIALHPQELGQINIRLSQTSQGLLARVSAETPAAAQALAAGRAELHQSLSSLGVSLLRLDIGFGQPESGERQGPFAGDPNSSGASSSSRASSTIEGLDGPEATAEPDAPVPSAALAGGALVDVLAGAITKGPSAMTSPIATAASAGASASLGRAETRAAFSARTTSSN